MGKPLFVISAAFDTYSGYGARSRDLIKSIINLNKYNVKLISQSWGDTSWGFIKNNPEWEFLNDYLMTPEDQNNKPDIWMQITVPNEFRPIGKYNIGVTAAMETTLVDGGWIEGVNRMDLTLVSSQHSKDSLTNTLVRKQYPNGQIEEIKVNKPIEILFEGIDVSLFKENNNEPDSDFLYDKINEIPEDKALLVVGHWMQGDLGEDRKNIGLTIKTFLETFKNTPNAPALILKTSRATSSYNDRDTILKKYTWIKNQISGELPNVYLLHGSFTDKEMNNLYNHPKIKGMVSLTKGEGFGRPLLEFSLIKKPIIVSGWSGHLDFLKPEFVTFIPGELKNVHPSAVVEKMIIPESSWFSPNISEVSKAYKNLFKNYSKHKQNAIRQAFFSKSVFSHEKMTEKLDEYLTKYLPKFAEKVELKLPQLNKPAIKLPQLKRIK